MFHPFIQLIILCLFCLAPLCWAKTYVLPLDGNLIGKIQYTFPQEGETLIDVGIRYNIGYEEMIRANPKVDPTAPLSLTTKLLIPSRFILPSVPYKGLVINLADFRLYYFPPHENVVITMPVGIGREGWKTPIGFTKIISKERNPIWRPSPKLRVEAAKNGIILPSVFPASDDSPLGLYALRLAWPTYLIHGSNRREGIGTRVSAGCIRMLPEDIEYLFSLVNTGTSVRIIHQAVKFGYHQGAGYVQVHPALIEHKKAKIKKYLYPRFKKIEELPINQDVLKQELKFPTGVPKKITA